MVGAAQSAVKLLSICGQVAPVAAWQRAIERARSEGVKVYRQGGEWTATSVSHPGERHQVGATCDCEGAVHGRVCKHLAAVRSAQLKLGELARCDYCGRVGPLAQMAEEARWVGGVGFVWEHYCGEGFGHQVVG